MWAMDAGHVLMMYMIVSSHCWSKLINEERNRRSRTIIELILDEKAKQMKIIVFWDTENKDGWGRKC